MAVSLRPFERVSATQIGNYQSCNRLWWFEYVLGLKTKQRASAALGEMVHSFLEDYLNDGTKPDVQHPAGKIADMGLALLPAPGSVLVEINMRDHPANDLKLAGVDVSGRLDVVIPSVPVPEVLDHKTSGNLAYAKTAQDLLTDPQIILYCAFVLRLMEFAGYSKTDVTGIKGTHVVYPTKGKYTAAIRTSTDVMSRDHVAEQLAGIELTVADMKKTALLTRPGDVPPTLSSCSKYGGCHFLTQCAALNRLPNDPNAPQVAKRGLFYDKNAPVRATSIPTPTPTSTRPGDNRMSVLDTLKAKLKAEADAAGGTNAGTNGAGTTDAPKMSPLEALRAKKAAEAAGTSTASATSTTSATSGKGMSSTELLNKWGLKAKADAVGSTATSTIPSIVPADAPDGDVSAVAEPAKAAAAATTTAPAATGAKSRKPRNAAQRIAALGWAENQIERMTVATMHHILDNEIKEVGHSILPDGTCVAVKPATANTAAPDTSTPSDDVPDIEVVAEEVTDDVWIVKINGQPLKNEKGKNASFPGEDLALNAGYAEVERREKEAAAEIERAKAEAAEIERAKAEAAEAAAAARAAERKPAVTPEIAAAAADILDQIAELVSKLSTLDVRVQSDAAMELRRIVGADVALEQLGDGLAVDDITLYIDCLPSKGAGKIQFLEAMLAPYMAKVAEYENVAHYSLLEYGKGPHMLAAFMMQEPPTGIIVCNTRFPATNACLEVLQPMAKRIVRAW